MAKTSQFRSWLLASSGLFAAIMATPAYAQDAAPPAAQDAQGDGSAIVVTANRREERITDVGIAVQAFTGEQLSELRVTSTEDLQVIVPSLNVSRGYQGIPIYTLRGIGFNTINLSATSTVGTYQDEVALAFHDIRPQAPVHVLVIPKGAYVSWDDFTAKAPDAEIAAFMRAVGTVTRQLELDGPGYRLMVNMGQSGHQEVPHLHVHIFGGRQFYHMICD